MARTLINHIARFIFMILLQVLVVNRLDLWDGLILPFIYIHALLMLPIEMPTWVKMLIGFFMGLIVDGFMNTPGFHASACVWLTLLQGGVIRFLAPREGYEFGQAPTIYSLGIRWYVLYAGILALLFHMWIFFIEVFRFSNFFTTLSKAVTSAVAAIILLILAQFLTYPQRPRT